MQNAVIHNPSRRANHCSENSNSALEDTTQAVILDSNNHSIQQQQKRFKLGQTLAREAQQMRKIMPGTGNSFMSHSLPLILCYKVLSSAYVAYT